MNEVIVLILVVLVVLSLLVWRFDVVKFTLEGLKIKTSAEGSRTPPTGAASDASAGGPTHASGDGAAAISGGAEDARVRTDVQAPHAPAPQAEPRVGTVASGAGSVAISEGAKGAHISTKVRRSPDGRS